MFPKRKRLEDKSADDRQKIIEYKKFFSSEEGKSILFDLMNRYYVLNPLPTDGRTEFQVARAEGQRTVVIDILTRCNVDMAQFDKLLKGEL